MTDSRAEFASILQATLMVLQAIVVVGFVGIVVLEPDPTYLLPVLTLNGYLLALAGAALIYFRREHAARWREQLPQRAALFCDRAWPHDAHAANRSWQARLFGADLTQQGIARRGAALLIVGMLISTATLARIITSLPS